MNGIAAIMVRVSSTEGIKNQNFLVQDFKNLHKREEIPFKTKSNLKNRHQHKYKISYIIHNSLSVASFDKVGFWNPV